MQLAVEVVNPYCCGLDVHKNTISACILTPTGKLQKRFGTLTHQLKELSEWLRENRIPIVAMESTGVFWKPVYNILEEEGFEQIVVNPQHLKCISGRKTDTTDAEWLATLLRLGLLKPSFIPSRQDRDLRELSRYRVSLVQDRTRHIQRVQKILEGANIKIGSLLSDVNGLSGRTMLKALIDGDLTPEQISTLGQSSLKHSPDEFAKALQGRIRGPQRFLLQAQLTMIDTITQQIKELEQEIEALTAQISSFKQALDIADSVPGIGRQAATSVLIETGLDMSRFPTVKHISAWGGLAPGNNESAGKRKSAKTRKGNIYLKNALIQAARSLHRTKNCRLAEQYQRIKARRGSNRATVAVAHTILRILYYLLLRKEMYQERGASYFTESTKKHLIKRHVKELAKLGLVIPNEIVDQQLVTPA